MTPWIQRNQSSLADMDAQIEQIEAYRSQNALADMKMQDYERKAETADRFRAAFTPGADPNDAGFRQSLYAADPASAAAFYKSHGEGESTRALTDKRKAETWNMRLDWLGRTGDQRAALSFLDETIADGTKEWTPIRERIAGMSPEEAKPFIQNLAMKVKDQAAQQLDEREFGETKRHNVQTEGAAWQRASRPDTVIQMTQERAADKEVGKYYGSMYTGLQEGGIKATGEEAKLNRLEGLLDQVNTGRFAGTTLELKKIVKGFGVDLDSLGVRDDVAPAEAATALTREIALNLRNPSGGAGMPGAMSDQDRAFLESMVPGIETTPEGRKAIITTQRKLAQRSREVAELARQYRTQHGNIDEGFLEELARFSEQNPLFSEAGAPAAPPPNTSQAPPQELDAMPMPQEHPGKWITTPEGIKYRSDGKNWIKQ